MDQSTLSVVVDATHTLHSDTQNSPRRRELDKWLLVAKPAYTDPDLQIWCLSGWTVLEADGFRPPARHTVTSPIVACEQDIVTTASGSQYKLLTQSSQQPIFETQPGDPVVPRQYWNEWIEGNNWVTI